MHRFAPLAFVLAIPATLLLAPAVLAGPLTVVTPDGGTVAIGAKYSDGSTAVATIKDNGPGDENPILGKVTFTIPREVDVVRSVIENIGVSPTSVPTFEGFDWGPAGLLSFEPIDLPTFSSTDTSTILVTTIDVPAFVSSGGSSGVVQDGFPNTGGSFSSFFDVFVELTPSTLDPFLGPIIEGDAVQFRKVPEPGSLTLMGTALLGFAALRRRKTIAMAGVKILL